MPFFRYIAARRGAPAPRVAVVLAYAVVVGSLLRISCGGVASVAPGAACGIGAFSASCRRQVLLLGPVAVGTSGWWLPPAAPAWSVAQDELPPLPQVYYDNVVGFTTAAMKALLTAAEGNRVGRKATDFAAQNKMAQEEAKLTRLLTQYEETYLEPSVASKLEPALLQHPVYKATKDVIDQLRTGGRGVDDLTAFRFGIVKSLRSIISLANKAGVVATSS